ncbi:MAG: hypothetical protein ACRD0K_13215, partial [Egibacteraceae bacterium]
VQASRSSAQWTNPAGRARKVTVDARGWTQARATFAEASWPRAGSHAHITERTGGILTLGFTAHRSARVGVDGPSCRPPDMVC